MLLLKDISSSTSQEHRKNNNYKAPTRRTHVKGPHVNMERIGRFPRGLPIGRASLARENEAGGSWGQEVHILHVNI